MTWSRRRAKTPTIYVSAHGQQLWLAKGEEYWWKEADFTEYVWFPKEGKRQDASAPELEAA